jgi:hypothetical protein
MDYIPMGYVNVLHRLSAAPLRREVPRIFLDLAGQVIPDSSCVRVELDQPELRLVLSVGVEVVRAHRSRWFPGLPLRAAILAEAIVPIVVMWVRGLRGRGLPRCRVPMRKLVVGPPSYVEVSAKEEVIETGVCRLQASWAVYPNPWMDVAVWMQVIFELVAVVAVVGGCPGGVAEVLRKDDRPVAANSSLQGTNGG